MRADDLASVLGRVRRKLATLHSTWSFAHNIKYSRQRNGPTLRMSSPIDTDTK